MSLADIKIIVANRTGKTVAQDGDQIDIAIAGAIREYGIHVDVPAAQKTESKPIAASANSVDRPLGYSRINSVVYRYSAGSGYQTASLIGVTIGELDRANQGQEDSESDNISMFAVYSNKILVGPGHVSSGGTLSIRVQRPLTLGDVDDVPNPMAIVSGAVANLFPIGDENGQIARREFISSWVTESGAAPPVQQSYSEVALPINIQMDDAYRRSL